MLLPNYLFELVTYVKGAKWNMLMGDKSQHILSCIFYEIAFMGFLKHHILFVNRKRNYRPGKRVIMLMATISHM